LAQIARKELGQAADNMTFEELVSAGAKANGGYLHRITMLVITTSTATMTSRPQREGLSAWNAHDWGRDLL
jgi:hypothetical protein